MSEIKKEIVDRRDYFTIHALQGILLYLGYRGIEVEDEEMVEHAVKLAEALINALDEKDKTTYRNIENTRETNQV